MVSHLDVDVAVSILGHHWHGVTSRRGCEGVVDVSAASVEHAVHSYLRLWLLEHSS